MEAAVEIEAHNKVNQTELAELLVPLTLPPGRGRLFQRYI